MRGIEHFSIAHANKRAWHIQSTTHESLGGTFLVDVGHDGKQGIYFAWCNCIKTCKMVSLKKVVKSKGLSRVKAVIAENMNV